MHIRRVGGQQLGDDAMVAHYAAIAARLGGKAVARYKNAICLVLGDGEIYAHFGDSISGEAFYIVATPHPKRLRRRGHGGQGVPGVLSPSATAESEGAMTQFGMPTLLETKSIAECAALCRELGLSFIELSMDLPEYQPDGMDATYFRGIAEQHSIFYTVHLSGFLNPCDFNARVAAAYTATVLDTIAIAKRLGIPILNMHLFAGDYFTLPDRKVCLFDEYTDVYLQKLTAFRNACTAAIGGADIKICVENTRSFQQAFGAKSLSLLLESPAFALTFDVGHDAGSDFGQQPLIHQHIDRLRHMHLHDQVQAKGDHLPFGKGALELEKYLQLAQQHDCRAVIEVKTIDGLRQSVDWLKARGWM